MIRRVSYSAKILWATSGHFTIPCGHGSKNIQVRWQFQHGGCIMPGNVFLYYILIRQVSFGQLTLGHPRASEWACTGGEVIIMSRVPHGMI